MAKNEDLRTTRTKTLIKKAFADLIQEKDIESITVKELAEKAGINRGTFYLHYKDVHDIIEKMKMELVGYVEDTLKEFHEPLETPLPLINDLYKLVEKDYWIYKAVINAKWSGQFTKTVKALLIEKCLECRGEDATANPRYVYLLSFIISGAIGMFTDWVNNKEPFPLEVFHDTIEKYITVCLKDINV